MKYIKLYEDFANEAKLNTLKLTDDDAQKIWDQLVKMNIGTGDTDNVEMRKNWEIFKKHKGASISKIQVFTRYTDVNLLLVGFDIFPLNSKDREDYFKIASPQGIYMYIKWDNGNVTDANFKEAWKMSNSEAKKHDQSWFNTNGKIFSK